MRAAVWVVLAPLLCILLAPRDGYCTADNGNGIHDRLERLGNSTGMKSGTRIVDGNGEKTTWASDDAQVVGQRRSLLQDQTTECEFDVMYSVNVIETTNFEATFTVGSNREVPSAVQLSYAYVESDMYLKNTSDAIIASNGSAAGAPIRLLINNSIGYQEEAVFRTDTSFINPSMSGPPGRTSLNVQHVYINGVACNQTNDPTITFSKCFNAFNFFQSFVGAAPPTNLDGCTAKFCCGNIVPKVEVTVATPTAEAPVAEGKMIPPVSNPLHNATQDNASIAATGNNSSSDASNGGDANSSTKTSKSPSTPNDTTTTPEQQQTPDNKEAPVVSQQSGQAQVDPQASSHATNDQKSTGTSSNLGPLIGAVVGVALGLVLVAAIAVFIVRRRRRMEQEKQAESRVTDNSKSNGKNITVKANASSRSVFSRGSGTIVPRQSVSSKFSQETSSISPSSSSMEGSMVHHADTNGAPKQDIISPIDALPDDLPEDVTLYDQLGAGGFGTVFKGEWGGHAVAVKVLQTPFASSSREMDSFRQEIEVLSRLRHPNIIAFLAACTIPPDICIIEELAEGGSLHSRLHGPVGSAQRCRPLPLMDILQIGIDIAEAMVYLHPNIVHRDLKSQNVLLDSDGRAKVCDFGIAKFKDRTFLSTANGQAGTPAYMAPELFEHASATEKVDVYSFAILMWECLTGKIPWGHVPSPMQIIYYVGVLQQRPKLPATAPEELKVLIKECWHEDPHQRPDFREIVASLREMQRQMWLDGTSTITSVPDPEEPQLDMSDDTPSVSTSVCTKSTVGPIDDVYRRSSRKSRENGGQETSGSDQLQAFALENLESSH